MRLRFWLFIYGMSSLVLLFWLCFVCTPTKYERMTRHHTDYRRYSVGTDWSRAEILTRAAIAGMGATLLWHCARLPRAPGFVPLESMPPRLWRENRVLGQIDLVDLFAILTGLSVSIALSVKLPVVDFKLLFTGYASVETGTVAELLSEPDLAVIVVRLGWLIATSTILLCLLALSLWERRRRLRRTLLPIRGE